MKSSFAFAALLGTVIIMVLSFITGLQRTIHPLWPVTVYVAIVMGIGLLGREKDAGGA